MKNIVSLLSLSLLTLFTLSAQENNEGTLSTTTHRTFIIHNDGIATEYNIKILENRNYPLAWEQDDKGKVNQDRAYEPAKVTKMIAVDHDSDHEYEQFFVLKYKKSITDTFELVPTTNGFAVKVDGKIKQRFNRDGLYFINNDVNDFFSIVEFREMS